MSVTCGSLFFLRYFYNSLYEVSNCKRPTKNKEENYGTF